jgi:PKD repeat protein
MKTRSIFTAAVIFALFSCEKRDYPPEQVFNDQEVFRVKAQVGSEEIDLRAGANSYYCYSSCEQGLDGVNRLTGELRKFNCNPCPESFYMHINDLRPRPASGPVPVDSVLKPGAVEIAPPGSHVNSFRFSGLFNMTPAAYYWDFGDGTTASDSSPLHEYKRPGRYKVCLRVVSASNCENTACNDVLVLSEGALFFSRISALTLSDRKARFTANVTGNGPFTYAWHFGDGSSASTGVADHEYKWPGGYPVKLIVKDAAGNTVEATYNYVTNGDPSSCAANFGVQHEGLVLKGLGKVKIAWTDKSNVVYSSDNINQPAESYFQIMSASEFDRNENGMATKLITARMNVLLSDGTRSFWLKSDEAVLAVGYK